MEASGPRSGSVPWGNETARWPQNGEGDSKHNSVNFRRMNRRGLQHQKGEKREEKKKWNEIRLKQKYSEGCERKGKQRTKGKSTKGQDRRRRTTEKNTKQNKTKKHLEKDTELKGQRGKWERTSNRRQGEICERDGCNASWHKAKQVYLGW